ncbi:hypothetical protein PoB_000459600 [Plakobranchus ocellatus]|uniref:Uncharacterized protein n=1 Tax=Plakobranchus ocellatus TaxID=259542 RepID=A0AAV3Y4H0_9GAST|nr:hypothetical protein PoB_000459600 [Plakobranchus ocellatus]
MYLDMIAANRRVKARLHEAIRYQISPHRHQRLNVINREVEERLRMTEMTLRRLTHDLPQRTRDFLVSQPVKLKDLVLLWPSSPHGNQRLNTISLEVEDRLRMAQMTLRRLTHDLPQRTRDFLELPRLTSEERVNMNLDILKAVNRRFKARLQEERRYQTHRTCPLCRHVMEASSKS